MAWRWPGDKPVSEPVNYDGLLMHIWITRPQWVKAFVMHICISNMLSLVPIRIHCLCQCLTVWTNAGLLIIRPLGTNLNEIQIKIHQFPYKKINLKISALLQQICLGLIELDLIARSRCLWYVWIITSHRNSRTLLYPPYPKDRGMLWFYVEAARCPPPAARRPQWC